MDSCRRHDGTTGTRRDLIRPPPRQPPRSSHLEQSQLSVELFGSLLEAKVMIEDWRVEYNTHRWHSSLGGMAPAVYAQMLRTEKQPA